MRHFNPIQTQHEFNSVCKANLESFTRILEYVIDDLDSGWRTLSRKDTAIRKHQLEFLEELQTTIENASVGPLHTGVKA